MKKDIEKVKSEITVLAKKVIHKYGNILLDDEQFIECEIGYNGIMLFYEDYDEDIENKKEQVELIAEDGEDISIYVHSDSIEVKYLIDYDDAVSILNAIKKYIKIYFLDI